MKFGFYFRFCKLFHNEAICRLLSNIAYALYCCKYIFEKMCRKIKPSTLSYEEAHKIINKVYPKPVSNPDYSNIPVNPNLDLSIVIPVYNYAEILEDNILSIINQKTKYNYEAIFVDDGSTDGAKDILKKYGDNPKVKLIFQQNSGIGAARNTGIQNANGKYLMFVDCDDVVHSNMVEILLDEAYDKDCDMVMAAHNLVKEKNGEVLDVIPNIYPKYNLKRDKNKRKIMNYAGLPWAKVYKREIWNEVRFFPGYWHEDTIIQFLIFTQCKEFSYLPTVVYEYKWYEKNFSHTQNNAKNYKIIDRYWLLVVILEQYTKMALPKDEAFYALILKHISAYYCNDFNNLDNEVTEALFVLAKEIYEKYKPNYKVKLPYMLRQTEKAFENNDMNLWKLASSFQ